MSVSESNHLRIVLQLNLLLVLVHLVIYSHVPTLLQSLSNPFADVMLLIILLAPLGMWFCLDYLVSSLCELVQQHHYASIKPVILGVSITLGGLAFMLLSPAPYLRMIGHSLS